MVHRVALDDYVLETLLPDLAGHDHAPSAFLTLVKLWHLSGGPGRRLQVSLSTLAVETGLSKSSVQAALRHLRRRGFLETARETATAVPTHTLLAPWRR